MQYINWRQILLHFAACWFFIYGFQTLAFSWDEEIAGLLRQKEGNDFLNSIMGKEGAYSRYTQIINKADTSRLVGLGVGFCFSLLVTFRHKWHWINSVLVLAICLVLARLGWLGWSLLKYVFLTPGEVFKDSGRKYFLTNALVMVLLGTLIFILPVCNHFIKRNAKILTGKKIKPGKI
jgi:hypothetical protein